MTDELKKQFTLRISQATKTDLVIILYEMYDVYLSDAYEDLEKDEKKQFLVDMNRARGCLKELIGSLQLDVEPAPTLLQLYIYVSKLMVDAGLHGKKESILEARKLMKKLQDGYRPVCEQDQGKPILTNTQTVYAGLTYSKRDVCVNLDDGVTNRGFFA